MAEHTYIHSQHLAGAGPDHAGVEHEPREVVRVSSHGHVKCVLPSLNLLDGSTG